MQNKAIELGSCRELEVLKSKLAIEDIRPAPLPLPLPLRVKVCAQQLNEILCLLTIISPICPASSSSSVHQALGKRSQNLDLAF